MANNGDSKKKRIRETVIELFKLNNSLLQQLLAFVDNKVDTPDTNVGVKQVNLADAYKAIEESKKSSYVAETEKLVREGVTKIANDLMYDLDDSDNNTNEVIMMHLKAGMVISYEDGRRIPIQTDGTFRVFNGCKINWD